MSDNTFGFAQALDIVRGGGIVTRQCWKGTGLSVGVVVPEPFGGKANPMSPFLALRAPNGQLAAWAPSNQELFATDWYELSQMGVVGHG